MRHLQQLTDNGQPIEVEDNVRPNYSLETQPIEWIDGSAEEYYDFISEITKCVLFYFFIF